MHINHQSPLSGAGLTVALNPTLRSRSPFLSMSYSTTLNRLCQEENALIWNFFSCYRKIMYDTLMAHIQNTTPQLTPNRKSCIRSSLLQRSFENLAKFLVRKTLTIGAKVLSPFSLSDQFLTHVPYSCLILSLHTQYTTVSRDCQVFFCVFWKIIDGGSNKMSKYWKL